MLHGGVLFFILGSGPKEIRYDVHYPHFTMANPTVSRSLTVVSLAMKL